MIYIPNYVSTFVNFINLSEEVQKISDARCDQVNQTWFDFQLKNHKLETIIDEIQSQINNDRLCAVRF